MPRKVKKMLHEPVPAMDRLVKLALKELKQMNDAKYPMRCERRCRVQAIANYAEGCCSLAGVKHHFIKFSGDYGLTGTEAAALNQVKAMFQ